MGAPTVGERDTVVDGAPGSTAVKTVYDAKADALFVRFSEVAIVDSAEVAPGVVLDFDKDGRIVAMEVLDARRHMAARTEFPTAAE